MVDIKRILLAEDNPKDVELTLAALDEHKLANEVVVVNDGQETLDYLRREGKYKLRASENPAVVLLDLKMPKVDGLEILRVMKSDEALKAIPVVMLTSSREEQDLVESYKLGVNAYLVKPVDFQEFFEAVKGIGVFWILLKELLASEQLACEITCVDTREGLLEALDGALFDLVLVDYKLPSLDGRTVRPFP